MQERLRAVLDEIEDMNAQIQQGCVDPQHLSCFSNEDDPESVMAACDLLIGLAYSNLDHLLAMMKEEEQ